mmetsp:Transcript_80960/g.262370  ORF Transcript_80960/g.262370 Transcript_80960/m.262370 type:complete len:122 (-) Transcript_80960:88-453(-)|eukprot:CAMPEP_0204036302 /NCGR_PEP_ID=MMETSP0360-20130528/79310_1 /ASSEMBLY_ACC=CAM_ASM_000342 /TAXON_ID=268821 /ORGANISM="Scrippsiella Hangoei, Strain SHTV-5" /LENGTH=121 /DNA_ID=CAMNT_0050981477 /DNA_START=54 /DNA_END=419 /DNA_ORIENTATION=+
MGNRQTWEKATSCCNGGHETGTLVLACPSPAAKKRCQVFVEESSGRPQPAAHEDEMCVEVVSDGDDAPETTHPVAVNAFDKLTHLHSQIQHQLAAQESLIHKLLQDGDSMNAGFDEVKDSL